jgi:putative nucleotidyltransferase with HDIG domain
MHISQRAVFVWSVSLAGTGLLAYCVADMLSRPIPVEWIILLVLTVASGWAALRIPGVHISFSISDTFSIVAALLVGPSAGAITAALDGLVLSWNMKNSRRTVERVFFNTAVLALATWIAAEGFVQLGGPRTAVEGVSSAPALIAKLAVFGTLVFGLNTGLVALAISLERHESIVAIWRRHFAHLWVTYFGGVFAAMLMMLLGRSNPLHALILLGPVPVIIYVAFRHAMGRAEDEISHLGKVNNVYLAAIEALAHAIDAKDQVTSDHIRRVQDNSLSLAQSIGVADDLQLQAIRAASLLHDVGKLAVPEHILNKPGKLTASEFEVMKRHAPVGADILSMIEFPYPVVPIVRHHHENWDGTGYPDGLSGENIPIGARILQVVDCFDALTSDRPYRPRMDTAAALQILKDRRGVMYDPRIVDAFVEIHSAASTEHMQSAAGSDIAVPSPAVLEPARSVGGSTETADYGHPYFDLFYQLGGALKNPASLSSVGQTLWEHLEPHMPEGAFVFFNYSGALDALVPCYRGGDIRMSTNARIPLGSRVSGWAAANRKSALNADARLDIESDLRGHVLSSVLAVPACIGDRCLGVLAFYSIKPAAFTEQHCQLAEAAARIAAQCASRVTDPVAPVPAR